MCSRSASPRSSSRAGASELRAFVSRSDESTGHFRRAREQSPRALMSAPQAVPQPNIELHVHLEGARRRETLVEIALRNDYPLPAETEEGPSHLYDFRDFAHFIEV